MAAPPPSAWELGEGGLMEAEGIAEDAELLPAIDGNDVPYCTAPGIYNATLDNMLIASKDMPVQIVEINAAIPLADLWAYVCVE